MLRLLLLRHAEAERPAGAIDRARPLSQEGLKASQLMGSYIARSALAPTMAVVSSALRTQQTWEQVAPSLQGDIVLHLEPRLYDASAATILRVIAETAPTHRTLLLVGHNPGFHEVAIALSRSGDRSSLATLRQGLPTGGLVVIEFDLPHWYGISSAAGQLERYVTPRSIGAT